MAESETYTHGHHASVLRSHQWRTAGNSVGYMLANITPGTTIVDVGSGPGTITADLAERASARTVVGIDAVPTIVEAATHSRPTVASPTSPSASGTRITRSISRTRAPTSCTPTRPCTTSPPAPRDALREFARVARPGGIIAAREVDYEGVIWYPLIPALTEWLDVYLRVHRGSGGRGRRGPSSQVVGAGGGACATSSRQRPCGSTSPDEDRAWWGGSWADRVLHSAFALHALGSSEADQAALQRIADGWLEWAAAPDGWLLMPPRSSHDPRLGG